MTAWPEGVIARYLTVGGATVDITDENNKGQVATSCQGCTWTNLHFTNHYFDDTPEQVAAAIAKVLPIARHRSQQHAETCRAMPNPGAGD